VNSVVVAVVVVVEECFVVAVAGELGEDGMEGGKEGGDETKGCEMKDYGSGHKCSLSLFPLHFYFFTHFSTLLRFCLVLLHFS
jgi:hypothetical protein